MMRHFLDKRNNKLGVSIAEYAIIGMLVTMVSIAGMSLVGKNLHDTFQNLYAMMTNQVGKTSEVNAQQAASKAVQLALANQTPSPDVSASSASSGTTTTAPTTGAKPSSTKTPMPTGKNYPKSQAVCFQNGCIDIPVVKKGPVTLTAGALGGELVESVATTLMQIAELLAQDPNVDPALLDLVTKLALQGHDVSDAQKALVAFCPNKSCGLPVAKNQTNPTQTKVDNYIAGIDSANTTFLGTFNQLQSYLAANPNALPPAYKDTINLEVQQINDIASAIIPAPKTSTSTTSTPSSNSTGGSSSSCSSTSGGGCNNINSGTTTSSTQTTTAGWGADQSTTLTAQSANTICENGGDTQQCVVPADKPATSTSTSTTTTTTTTQSGTTTTSTSTTKVSTH